MFDNSIYKNRSSTTMLKLKEGLKEQLITTNEDSTLDKDNMTNTIVTNILESDDYLTDNQRTRLYAKDLAEVNKLVEYTDKSKSEIIRDAVKYYLDHEVRNPGVSIKLTKEQLALIRSYI